MNSVVEALHGIGAAAASRDAAATSGGSLRVTVVVPTCGRPELLDRCLRALQAQTLPADRFEVVIVDDGGGIETARLVHRRSAAQPHPALRLLTPPPRRGPAAARNSGWRAARGDIVAFTDDDTIPAPDWLAQGTSALLSTDHAAVAGRVVVPRTGDAAEPPTDHARMTIGLERTEFVTANAFAWRAALLKVQGFDERFTRAWREDTDLQWRLEAAAGPVGRCEAAVVLHPVRPERWGVSLRQQKNAYFEALLYRKHPRRYRAQPDGRTPWAYYGIVALASAVPVLAAAGVTGSALVAGALALGFVGRFAMQRLRGTSHAPGHVVEMLATSAVIPFLSVAWRLRGAWRFRVWFG